MDVPAPVPEPDAGGRPAAGAPAAGAVQRPAASGQGRLWLAAAAARLPAVDRRLPAGPAAAAGRRVRAGRRLPPGDRAGAGGAAARPSAVILTPAPRSRRPTAATGRAP